MTVEEVEEKEAVVCQRENSFYVDTVRSVAARMVVVVGICFFFAPLASPTITPTHAERLGIVAMTTR